jgi:hypothetical protein
VHITLLHSLHSFIHIVHVDHLHEQQRVAAAAAAMSTAPPKQPQAPKVLSTTLFQTQSRDWCLRSNMPGVKHLCTAAASLTVMPAHRESGANVPNPPQHQM